MTQLKLGVEALQKALPGLPMGSEMHTAVLKALGDIGKHMKHEGGSEGQPDVMQALVALARQKSAQPQNPMLAQLAGGGGGGGGPPPPMGGGGEPPPPGE